MEPKAKSTPKLAVRGRRTYQKDFSDFSNETMSPIPVLEKRNNKKKEQMKYGDQKSDYLGQESFSDDTSEESDIEIEQKESAYEYDGRIYNYLPESYIPTSKKFQNVPNIIEKSSKRLPDPLKLKESRLPKSISSEKVNTVENKCTFWIAIIIPIMIVCFSSVHILFGFDKVLGQEEISIEEISKLFPPQKEDFWTSIKVGVEEVVLNKRPATFIFLFQENETFVNEIINEISNYALCKLGNCNGNPVVLEDLSTRDILKDYGKIIFSNKENLEQNGVMIVKHLEKVPGTSAQAFHSFCDEINPLVNKAVFIFTVKVESIQGSEVNYLENYLRNLWSDIDDAIFYPLFTRISSNVFLVRYKR